MKLLMLFIFLVFSFLGLADSREDYSKMEPRFILYSGGREGMDPVLKNNPLEIYEKPSLNSKILYKLPRNLFFEGNTNVSSAVQLFLPLKTERLKAEGLFRQPALKKVNDFYLIGYGKGYYWVHKSDYTKIYSIEDYFENVIQIARFYYVEIGKGILLYKSIEGEKLQSKYFELKEEDASKVYIEGKIIATRIFKNNLWIQLESEKNSSKDFADSNSRSPSIVKFWFRVFNDDGKMSKGWNYGYAR